ncbi:Solute carrier family 15 member 4 [Geodia barretti]|uniref:Solute carrier family 15 member 4 n=1 Tax=Geodia barretti TaxID=519541 RepID=A0AA35TN64_GEOBA|nr:Solute carrier family 15 member 4 [Geodia barretti]
MGGLRLAGEIPHGQVVSGVAVGRTRWCGSDVHHIFGSPPVTGPKSIPLYLLFVLIAVGSSGVEVNLIPFGADALLYKTSEELSSYFYWYYWGRNLGALAYILSFLVHGSTTHTALFSLSIAAALTLALSLSFICENWLSDDQERQNSPKLIWNILRCAFRAERPQARSAFSFTGEASRPQRLDLAKRQHGGKFHSEEVEDVKTFLRLLLLLFSIGGALTVYTGILEVMSIQFRHMSNHCSFTLNEWAFNVWTILVAIPIIDQFIYPILRQFAPNMLKRFGMSYVLLICSVGVLCLLEIVGHINDQQGDSAANCMFATANAKEHKCTHHEDHSVMPLSAYLILVPVIMASIAEIFLKVTALEFVYAAQSPHSMRGMMIGLFFWVEGIFSTLSAIVLFGFSYSLQWYSS